MLPAAVEEQRERVPGALLDRLQNRPERNRESAAGAEGEINTNVLDTVTVTGPLIALAEDLLQPSSQCYPQGVHVHVRGLPLTKQADKTLFNSPDAKCL